MSSSYRKAYVVLGAGALLGLAPGSRADNWEFLPRIQVGGTFNDNYRLAQTDADKLQVYGPFIDAQLAADYVTQRGKFEIAPRVRSDYFPKDHADQSTDGYLDIDGEYRTLRSRFTGLAQYSNESVIYSQLLPATFPGVHLGEAVGGETGRVSVSNREQLVRVVPDYIYDFTQRTHLNLQAEYDRATFDKSALQQVGFNNVTGQAGLLFDVTQRSTISVSGEGGRFSPQTGGTSANLAGANLEWDLRESQIMQFYARIGGTRTTADTANGTVAVTGVTGGMGVEWRYQITEVVLDALRAVSPSSAGNESVNDEIRFRVLHAFKPRFSGFVGARGVRVRGVSNRQGLAVQGEDYFTTEVGVDYQVTQTYRLEATYDYIWQRFQSEPSAQSNAVALSIIYQPLSRYEPLPELTGIPRER
ncbi:MAG TPA: hypothetical protein VFA39_12805 [Steroidobacteraceae bacterium]|nr:hypothetical protein [Steroidobacteraceae bacterium]